MSNPYQVVVVGGGPGGLSAGMHLHHLNINHVVLEKDAFPRDKICGDAVSMRGLAHLHKLFPQQIEDFLNNEALGTEPLGIRFFAPNLKSVDIAFPPYPSFESNGKVIKRLIFDNFLYELYSSLGNPVQEKTEYISHITTNQGVEIKIKQNGEEKVLKSDMILMANGTRSEPGRNIRGSKKIDGYHSGAVRAYFTNVKRAENPNFLELYFFKELIPGYFWIFDLPDGGANVGLGSLSTDIAKRKLNLKSLLLDLVKNNPLIKDRFVDAELDGKIVGWDLTLGGKKFDVSDDRLLLIGDAASMIDPFTGEGIGNAIMSGKFAAEHCLEAIKENNYSAYFNKKYDDRVYRNILEEMQNSKKLQDLTNYKWLFNFVVSKISKNKELQATFTNMFADIEARKLMQNPLFYFKILFS